MAATGRLTLIHLVGFIGFMLQLLETLIIVVAVMSWLIAFNVLNVYNGTVRGVWDGLNAVIDPLLRPIRQVLPTAGGLDLSPLVLILLIEAVRQVVLPNLASVFAGAPA